MKKILDLCGSIVGLQAARQGVSLILFPLLLVACSHEWDSPEVTGETITAVPIMSPVPLLTRSTHSQLVRSNTHEWLLVWGRTKVGAGGECHIWLFNPAKRLDSVRPVVGNQDCRYIAVAVNGQEYIASLPSYPTPIELPPMIVLYKVSDSGELVAHQEIPMGNLRRTHEPQWSADGSVYLSGILDGKEQIFRYDIQTALMQPYLDAANGFATEPLLSPDGRYLAYRVVKNNQSSDECARGCSFSFFHVWDIHASQDIALLPLVEPWIAHDPPFINCDLVWSPSSKFIAFDVGCNLQTPSSVAVIDVENRQAVEVIGTNSTGGFDNYIRKHKWLANDRLLLSGSVTFANVGDSYDGYFLYLAAEQTWQPLENVPKQNIYDYDWVAFGDWVEHENGLFAVGQTQVPAEVRTLDLVILKVGDENSVGRYIRVVDDGIDSPSLRWSSSGNYIAYLSSNWETRNSQSRFTIINRIGEPLLDTGMVEVVAPHSTWLRQHQE
jgi:hypothetical protein